MRDTSEIHNEIHVSQIHPDRYVSDMKETCGIHARYMRDTSGYMYPQRQSRYMRDTCGIHAGYMRDTCGTRISGVWGNVSMPSWRAAHLSGHPCPPCAEMGPLQNPPAPSSSPLSWPPLSLLVYRPGRARSAAAFPAPLKGLSWPSFSHLEFLHVSLCPGSCKHH